MPVQTAAAEPLPPSGLGVYSSVREKTRLLQGPQAVPSASSDVALLGRIAQGDVDAFQAFYGRYAGRILAYSRQLCRGRDVSEDVVQEVFVVVWRRAASFRPDRGDTAGWLYTITRNKLVDHWRRQDATVELDGADDRRLAGVEDGGDLRLTVRQTLSHVAPDQRRAIEMAYFGGLTYEETAKRLDLPVGTLKSRIRSGLKALRTLLESR